ncbi:hypothetical protein E4U52_006580 [Claviceps spartinae]|nr:hypothetical protein E4U52_006580 [Claviceps spartinae]
MRPKRLGRNPTMRVRSKIIHKKAKNALEDIGFNALNTLSFDDNVKKSKENAADASDVAIGATFNIYKDSEKLFRMFCGYLMINVDELGLDTFTKKQDGTLVVTMPVNLHATELTNLELEPEPESEPESIVCQGAIVCRATFCFLAKPIGDSEYDRVVKFI